MQQGRTSHHKVAKPHIPAAALCFVHQVSHSIGYNSFPVPLLLLHLGLLLPMQVLQDPGSADLSAWVDFAALRIGALRSGAAVRVSGPASQVSKRQALVRSAASCMGEAPVTCALPTGQGFALHAAHPCPADSLCV
jgi:hypothetical protein